MTDLEEEEVKENASTEYLTRLRISEYDNKQDKSSSDSNKTGVSSEDEEDESESNLQKTNLEYTDEEQTDKFRFHSSHTRSAKKNWAANTILSDDEDDHHDNSWVMKDSEEEEVKENVSMEHLTRLRKSKYDNKQHKSNSDPNETVFSSEDEEDNDGVDELEINLQNTSLEHIDEDHTDHFRVHSSNTRSASDDEDSYDDNALICTLIRQHSSCVMTDLEEEVKENVSRRRLTRLRKSESVNKQDKGSFDLNKPADSSDDEEDNNGVEESESNLHKTTLEYIDEDDTDEFRVHLSNARSAKRKWVAESDDEDSYDDNALICTLNTQQSSCVMTDSEEEVKENASRRRLTRLRKSESEDDEDIDGVDEPESEDESLDGFIMESSESVSICDSKSSDSTHESEDALNEYIEYKATMDKIRRKKNLNMKWDLEGDMLSDFAKDPRLCMSAVCVLYRQQTADEKESKDTRYRNGRGFSQFDAPRGCKLAEFLTDGDSNGDLVKTVEQLEEYDSEGIERCRELAYKYSKQLFEIYQNKEDHYFRPQR